MRNKPPPKYSGKILPRQKSPKPDKVGAAKGFVEFEENRQDTSHEELLKDSRHLTSLAGERVYRWYIYFLWFITGLVIVAVTSFAICMLAHFTAYTIGDEERLVKFLSLAWNVLSNAAVGAYVPLLIYLVRRKDR